MALSDTSDCLLTPTPDLTVPETGSQEFNDEKETDGTRNVTIRYCRPAPFCAGR